MDIEITTPAAVTPTIEPALAQTPPETAQPVAPTAQPTTERTFTQEEVTQMMAREKSQGRQAVLNELGVNDVEVAKNNLAFLKAFNESTKTPEQKTEDTSAALAALEARALEAERKLEINLAQGKAEYFNDITALAVLRVNDKTDFKTAVSEVAKLHPHMFAPTESEGEKTLDVNKGTGAALTAKKAKSEGAISFGQMAAAAQKVQSEKGGPDTFFGKK